MAVGNQGLHEITVAAFGGKIDRRRCRGWRIRHHAGIEADTQPAIITCRILSDHGERQICPRQRHADRGINIVNGAHHPHHRAGQYGFAVGFVIERDIA